MTTTQPIRLLSFCSYTLLSAATLSGCGEGEQGLSTEPLPPASHVWPSVDPHPEAGEDPQENPWFSGFPDENNEPSPGSLGAGSASHTASPDPESVSVDPDSHAPEDPPAAPLLGRRLEEYAEGKGSDKMLTISGVLGTSPSPCAVEIYSNGGTTPWRRFALPDEFPSEGTLSLCTATMADSSCSHEMTGSVFNGNDAVVLRCGEWIMDSIGRVGEDPGVAWIGQLNPQVRTEGQHLIRCSDAVDPDPTDFFDVSTQWIKLETSETRTDALLRCPSTPTGGPLTGPGGAGNH